MLKKNKLSIYNSKFLEIINEEIKTNPDIVNSKHSGQFTKNIPYIHNAARGGFKDKVAFLLENNANLYLEDDNNYNVLDAVIGGALIAKEDRKEDLVKNCYQIFRILLNYEAEQRACFPQNYKDQILLKDHKDKYGFTPQKSATADASVSEELQKAIAEAEKHYQKCLKAKSMGITLKPFHRQFLPQIEEPQQEVVIEATSTWTQKIDEARNTVKHRIKEGDTQENQPLLPKSESENYKNVTMTDEPISFVSRVWQNLFGKESEDNRTKIS